MEMIRAATGLVRLPLGNSEIACRKHAFDWATTQSARLDASPGKHLNTVLPMLGIQPLLQQVQNGPPDTNAATYGLHTPALPVFGKVRPVTGGKSRAKVLVADDNADMCNYLRQLLQDNYEVNTITDGLQALQAAKEQKPDLVLADIMLPKLDGFGLLKALRADPATAMIPVILLSARTDEEMRVQGIEAGADDYIIKPFTVRELHARVNRTAALARFRGEALRHEQELRADTVSILENTNEGFCLVDANWAITYLNATSQRICGISRDLLIGMNYWDVLPTMLGTIVEEKYRWSMANRTPVKFEYFYPTCNRWYEVSASPVSNGGLLLSAYDITTRKRAEEALKATEARLTIELGAMTRLHDLSTRLLTIHDSQSALEEVLDASIEMLGATMGSIQLFSPHPPALKIVAQRGLSQSYLDYFKECGIKEDTACGRAAMSRTRIIIEDVQAAPEYAPYREIVDLTGFRAIQSTPLMSPDGQLLGILSTLFDSVHCPSERDFRMLDLYAYHAISLLERIRAEEALRESEARFRTLAEASPALIWQTDTKGNIVYANPQYRDLAGVELDRIIGTGWLSIIHPEDTAASIAALEQAQRQRARFHLRMRVKSKDGDWRWLDSHALPLFNAEGEYAGHVGISIDINEAVRAEEALREADRRKDEFLATLAHELRNPLAPISNAMHLLKRSGGNQASIRLNEMMERQVNHIIRLVDDLLEVSRITRGKIELRKAPVDLADVIRSAAETSKPLMDSARHHLTVSFSPKPLILDADSVRLTQVFANLLNNAAKYTDEGGQILLSARRENEHAIVSVRDNGIGIPSDMLPHVFEMFTQVHRSSGRGQGGLGIGLTMVRSLVEMHGGSVDVHSGGPGGGSEFIVRLPFLDNSCLASSRHGQSMAAPDAAFSGQRILVVDDNRDAADSLAMLLASLGADARAVYDGQSALTALDNFQPFIVLLDIGMPDMDGYEVAQRIRQQARFNDIRIIALTGWGQEADRLHSRASGFDQHLTKPVDIGVLEALLAASKNSGGSPP